MKENFENKEEIIEKCEEKAEDKEGEEEQAPKVEDKKVSS